MRANNQTRKWCWDVLEIAERGAARTVGDILVMRFDELPEETVAILRVACCIGTKFDVSTLSEISKLDPIQTFSRLLPAIDGRILLVERQNVDERRDAAVSEDTGVSAYHEGGAVFRFAHQKIVERASPHSVEEKEAHAHTSLLMARLLEKRRRLGDANVQLFEIVDYFNGGRCHLLDGHERFRLIELELNCARLAITDTAYSWALDYLDVAVELLELDVGAASTRQISFFVHLERARASYLSNRYDLASQEYPRLLKLAQDSEEILQVYEVQIEHAILAVQLEEGLLACSAALRLYGLEVPSALSVEGAAARQLAAVEGNMSGRDIAQLVDALPLRSESSLLQIKFLDRLALLAYLKSEHFLNAWAIGKMTNISLKEGHASASSFAYASFGFLMSTQGRHELGESFGRLGVALADKYRDPLVHGRAHLVYFALCSYFRKPLKEIPRPMYRAYPLSLEGGDLACASYLLVIGDCFRSASGTPLPEVRQDIERHLPFLRRSAPLSLDLFYRPYALFTFSQLTGELSELFGESFAQDCFLEKVQNIIIAQAWFYAALLKVETYTGGATNFDELKLRVSVIEAGLPGQYLVIESKFYASLQITKLLRVEDELSKNERNEAESLLELWQSASREAQLQCAANFAHLYQLVEGELLRCRGQVAAALRAYDLAIMSARQHGYLDKEALALQLCGDFYIERGIVGAGVKYLVEALLLFEKWGSTPAMSALCAGQPELDLEGHLESHRRETGVPLNASTSSISGGSSEALGSGGRSTNLFELRTVTQAARAISRETKRESLLTQLVVSIRESLGATNCHIIHRPGKLWVLHSLAAIPATDTSMFSKSVVNLVGRSGQVLVLNNPSHDSRWAHDPHIAAHRPRSLLCAPIRLDDRILALVYLENLHLSGAFSARHVELLDTILSQAAVSLDHVRLFSELSEEKERWHSLVDNAADLIVIVDRGCRVEFVNRSQSEFALGASVGEVIDAHISKEAGERLRGAIDKSFTFGGTFDEELELDTSSGRRYLAARTGPIRAGGTIVRVSVILTDVSERQALSEQLRHSQKMEAMGTFAGGVAHDFNNLLTVILGACELGETARNESERLGAFSTIDAAGTKAAQLTRKLLAFSRKQVLQPKVEIFDKLVGQATHFLDRLLGEDVRLVIRLGCDGGRVRLDPGALEQVIMNLVVNARDAMPRGGALSLCTRTSEFNGKPALALDVVDEGVGMDESTRERVFEPFFTTKAAGKGTGLGLSMVYGIVEQSHGTIRLSTSLAKGTTFTLLFPVHEGGVEVDERRRNSSDIPRGVESILLVDDDDGLRGVVGSMLRRLGYVVASANSGAAALKMAATMKKLDLLLTDVVMPGMGGPELALQLREESPKLPVLFMSGYNEDAILRHGVLSEAVSILSKPFSIAVMGRKVRKVLDADEASSSP